MVGCNRREQRGAQHDAKTTKQLDFADADFGMSKQARNAAGELENDRELIEASDPSYAENQSGSESSELSMAVRVCRGVAGHDRHAQFHYGRRSTVQPSR